MKLQTTINTIEQAGNISEANSFKMRSSRKAFQILSDLYSDKALAIVRELGCNAADSHVMAKQDKPFHIHLPNNIEPWITIQDFGTGISHENIYNIYATYFESTKTESNEQIGCLGLGSKSPFCYTDNFVVTSIHNGEKRIYNAYFAENGNPTIALVSASPTKDSNGLAIQIPVKAEDFEVFKRATMKAFRFFDVKPTISGNKIDWTQEEPIFKGEDWRSYDKFDYNECFAIMGGVTYPININKLKAEHHQMAYKGGLVLYFKMGEIDFTPSRESLSYCDQTIKALNTKFDHVKADFVKRVNEMLEQKPTLFDAIKMIYVLQNKYAHVNGLTISGKKIEWKGVDITNPIDTIRKMASLNDKHANCITTFKKATYYKTKVNESIHPSLEKSAKWMYDDETIKNPASRIKFWCRENAEMPITFFNKVAYQNLVKNGFRTDLFEPVSNLPKPAVQPRKTRNGGQATQKVKGAYNVYVLGNCDNKSWEAEEIDPADSNVKYPKYYIIKPKDDWSFKINTKQFEVTSKNLLSNLLGFMGIDKSDCVMVAAQNVKRLPNTCTPFQDHVDATLDLTYDKNGMMDNFKWSITHIDSIRNKTAFSKLDANHPFKVFIEKVYANHTKYKKFRHYLSSQLSLHNINGKETDIDKVKHPLIHKIVRKIGSYQWEDDLILEIMSNIK